jgi:hypothetical protein
MKRWSLFILLALFISGFPACDFIHLVEIIGFSPNAELVAWHVDGCDGAGGYEYYIVASTADMSEVKKIRIYDAKVRDDYYDTEQQTEAKREEALAYLDSLQLTPGMEMPGENGCQGSYRWLDENRRIYLKGDISSLLFALCKWKMFWGQENRFLPCDYYLEIDNENDGTIEKSDSSSVYVEELTVDTVMHAIKRQFRSNTEGCELRSVHISLNRRAVAVIIRDYSSSVGPHCDDRIIAFPIPDE